MPRFIRNKKIEDEFRESIECGDKDGDSYTEKLLLYAREVMSQQMERGDISRADLAKLLNCSRSYITQLLNGSTNVGLGTLVKVLFALGVKPTIHYEYENVDISRTFKKDATFELDFKGTTNTRLIVENKISQQEYEPT